MNLSKFDILSCSTLSFDLSFHCKKDNAEEFNEYDIEYKFGVVHLKTEDLNYANAKFTLAKLFMKIKEYGKTEWDDIVKVNISFPKNILKIYQLNALKLVLSTNEEILYKTFPDRKNRIGSRSVLETVKSGSNTDSIRMLLCSNVYGIDLSDSMENEITYRYIGGSEYETKFDVVSMILDKWILNTYYVAENPVYTPDETDKLSKLTKTKTNIDDVFVSYNAFKKKYSNINLLVDLRSIEGQENVFWSVIKERLMDVMKSLNISNDIKMTINYDSDEGRLQIKDSKLYGISGLHDIDVIDCILSGDVCRLSCYFSHITNSSLEYCDLFNGCDVMKSKLSSCYVSDGATIDNSIIDGDSTVSGSCAKCILTDKVKYTKTANLKHCKNDGNKIG